MSTETNDKKRSEMARLVGRLLKSGWKVKDLSAYLRVSPSTVKAWARGASMGTNAQRATLAGIGTPEEQRPKIIRLIALLEDEVRERTRLAELACLSGAFHVAEAHSRGIPAIRYRIEILQGLVSP